MTPRAPHDNVGPRPLEVQHCPGGGGGGKGCPRHPHRRGAARASHTDLLAIALTSLRSSYETTRGDISANERGLSGKKPL